MPPLYYEDGHDTIELSWDDRDNIAKAAISYYVAGYLKARHIKPEDVTRQEIAEATQSFKAVDMLGYFERIEEVKGE
jgi:hypothetical protein